MKLSIIVPAYNEERTIGQLLEKVAKANIRNVKKEIIIIDDCSNDSTVEKVLQFKKKSKFKNIKLLRHEENRGKGTAIRTGIRYATGGIIIIQDADLEYDPNDYYKLIEPIINNKVKVVYGIRKYSWYPRMHFIHALGNKLLNFITNILYHSELRDVETCYKVFKKDIMNKIHIKAKRFDFEPEFTAKILKKGYKIYQVPVSFKAREYHDGKKITIKDGIYALFILIKYRFVD